MPGALRRRLYYHHRRMTTLAQNPNATRRRNLYLIILFFLIIIVLCVLLLFPFSRKTSRHPVATVPSGDLFFADPLECSVAPVTPKDRRKQKRFVKIVNFNAEWLFLYGGKGVKCPSGSCPWSTYTLALNHLQDVADILTKVDADVVHLSEVEDCRVLKRLLSLMPKDHGYVPYLVLGRDHATGQNTGMLTRIDPISNLVRTEKRGHYPLSNSKCNYHRPGTTGVTKHYVTKIKVANESGKERTLVFAGLHFLAGPTDRGRCSMREAQAEVMKGIIGAMSQDDESLVIMGDFNDYDESAIGVDGRAPLSRALKILYDSAGNHKPVRNVAGLIPVDERYTCWYDANRNCRVDGPKEKVLIDHILISSELELVDPIIHHDYVPSCDYRISDHWPFSVKILL